MPYIPDEKKISKELGSELKGNREILDPIIDELAAVIGRIHTAYAYDGAFLGLINYSVTRLVTKIVLDQFDRPRYWHSPAIRGTMKDIGDELYRRVFVPYEEMQIKENGDVPEYIELLNRLK